MSATHCQRCGLPSGWLARHARYRGVYASVSPGREPTQEWGAAFQVRLSPAWRGPVLCQRCRGAAQPMLSVAP